MSTPPRASLKVLGLLLDAEPHPAIRDVLFGLSRWCIPRACDPALDHPSAWFASSVDAAAGVAAGTPLAIWVSDPAEASRAAARGAAVLVTCYRELEPVLGTAGLILPAPGEFDAGAVLPMPPFVRRRLRFRAGLPDRLVVDLREGADDAVAAAAVAPQSRLIEAMAAGTPVVTDPEAARTVGAHDEVELLTGQPHELAALAQRIASDGILAARLSRAGRRLAEHGREQALGHLDLARRLGLWPPQRADSWRMAIEPHLLELRTPANADIRSRLETMMNVLDRPGAPEGQPV